MTHNDFDFYEDLIRPLMRFLCQINILQNYEDSDDSREEPEDNTTPRRPNSHRYKEVQQAPKEASTLSTGYLSNFNFVVAP
jgi:hypothetical protein